MNFRKIRLRYRRREDSCFCPDCMEPLKWKFDGVYWIPCDREPVLFWPDGGEDTILYHGQLLTHALIYRPGLNKEKAPMAGHRPHYFTCPFGGGKNNAQ